MTDESVPSAQEPAGWQARHAYVLALVCLVVGLAVGYLVRGSASPAPSTLASTSPASAQGGMASQMPSLEQMKHMADKQAGPLFAKLKAEPNNAALLVQIGDTYNAAHQFREAASYYEQALKIDPKNVGVRTEMASCIFYGGDIDGALAQLSESLLYDPADANTLFNIGMIKLKGKKDNQGAVEAWRELLKKNPKLDPQKKATVEKLIADTGLRSKTGE